MWRDIDPRPDERERPQLGRGGGGDQDRDEPRSSEPRDVFSRDLDLPRGTTEAAGSRPRSASRTSRV